LSTFINNNRVLLLSVQRTVLGDLACASVVQRNTTSLNSLNNLVLYDN